MTFFPSFRPLQAQYPLNTKYNKRRSGRIYPRLFSIKEKLPQKINKKKIKLRFRSGIL